MPTNRIPPAQLSGPFGRLLAAYARRAYGQVPDNALVFWHNRRVLRGVLAFERRVATWRTLDAHLKTYAVMASAATIGCSWCLDFGYYMAHHRAGRVQGT